MTIEQVLLERKATIAYAEFKRIRMDLQVLFMEFNGPAEDINLIVETLNDCVEMFFGAFLGSLKDENFTGAEDQMFELKEVVIALENQLELMKEVETKVNLIKNSSA